jgi:glycosyltransferase involved in cell wall biosynthesis
MRIGVVPSLRRSDGGIYQYGASLLSVLRGEASASCPEDEFVLFTRAGDDPDAIESCRAAGWTIRPLYPEGGGGASSACPHPDARRHDERMSDWFAECGVELMLYGWPHRLAIETDVPFCMAVHDLQHRLQPEFPEVSVDGEWQRREYVLRNAVQRAIVMLCDSETGQEDLLACYGGWGLCARRVAVLPYLPSWTLESLDEKQADALVGLPVLRQAGLPERFVFYPAQYWLHKNHARLVQAIGALHREGLDVPLVLCGSADGAMRSEVLEHVRYITRHEQVAHLIHHLGYVADAALRLLYSRAAALVMPTFFGPTNIPILEAWAGGCPVVTSDVRGIREQVGTAALLVDPRSAHSIAQAIRRVWTEDALRMRLATSGRERLSRYGRAEYARRLMEIVAQARSAVRQRGAAGRVSAVDAEIARRGLPVGPGCADRLTTRAAL